MNVFETDRPSIHTLAYNMNKPKRPGKTPTSFRSERGRPFQRAGSLVAAVPQFTTLTLYSPTSANNQLPTITTNSTSISRPGRAGQKFP